MQRRGGSTKAAAALAALACLAGLTLAAPASAQDTPLLVLAVDGTSSDPWLDATNRQAVIDSYTAEFDQTVPDMGWTGDHETCETGATNAAFRSATIDRVNWFRAAAGLPPVTESAESSAIAQQAVLTTALAPPGGLSHHPSPDQACYSQAAYDASNRSNLYKGRSGPNAIDGYMTDWGAPNVSAGHRNWILSPTATQFGTGDAQWVQDAGSSANVLLVVESDEVLAAPNPMIREPRGFVAWPNSGFVPAEVVFPRWSFSLRNADFSRATVTTHHFVDGSAIDPVVVPSAVIFDDSDPGAAPQEIIVWEPALGFPVSNPAGRLPMSRPSTDQTYRVTIDGVDVGGVTESFTYDVTVIGDAPSTHQVAALEQAPAPLPVPPAPVSVVRSETSINAIDRDDVIGSMAAANRPILGRASATGARVSTIGRMSSDSLRIGPSTN